MKRDRHYTVRMCRRQVAVVLALVAVSGCDFELFPAGPGPDRRIPEVTGTYVAPASGYTAITWSPSGGEVTFVSPDYRRAQAYHLESGMLRQLFALSAEAIQQRLASSSTTERVYDAALSSDGVDWFTTAFIISYDPADRLSIIRRHTAIGSTVLTDHGASGPGPGYPSARGVLAAPGQQTVAFIVSPESLFVLRRDAVPTGLGTGCTALVAFSPDESRVLCTASEPGSLRVFRLDDGDAQSIILPAPVITVPHVIRWHAQGIQALYWSFEDGRYVLYEQATGTSRAVTSTADDVGFGPVSWSGDGSTAASWTYYCAQSDGGLTFSGDGGRCLVAQALLYVIDVSAGTVIRVAVHTLTGDPSYQVAVSPAGSMVAYTVNRGLYLVDVR